MYFICKSDSLRLNDFPRIDSGPEPANLSPFLDDSAPKKSRPPVRHKFIL
jgi:hypothetical protein